MNERIHDIVRAAGGIVYDEDGKELTPMLVGNHLEKFAELIVKECAKVCSEVEDTYGNLNKIDIAVGAGVCASEIREHFGVEE